MGPLNLISPAEVMTEGAMGCTHYAWTKTQLSLIDLHQGQITDLL